MEPVFRICDTETVLRRIPYADLEAWVNDPLPDDAHFLDNDDEKPKFRLSDDQVWQQIIKIAGVTCSSDFNKVDFCRDSTILEQALMVLAAPKVQKIDKTKQREALGQLREMGASVRQLERLTGISRGIIQFAKL